MKLRALSATLLSVAVLTLTGCIAGLTYTVSSNAVTHGNVYIEFIAAGNSAAPEIVRITGFPAGTPAVASTITAPASGSFIGIGSDAAGNLYTASLPNTTSNITILVYANGATGTATPIRTITSTLMQDCDGFAVAPDGTVYFSDNTNGLLRFAATANGASTPTIFPDLRSAGMAVDKNGNFYISGNNNGSSSISVYNAGFTSETPSSLITIPSTIYIERGLAVDTAGNIDIAVYDRTPRALGVLVYSAGASGSATPARTIEGVNAGFGSGSAAILGIALDPQNNLYVRVTSNSLPLQILEFGPSATGNVAPALAYTPSPALSGGDSGYDITFY